MFTFIRFKMRRFTLQWLQTYKKNLFAAVHFASYKLHVVVSPRYLCDLLDFKAYKGDYVKYHIVLHFPLLYAQSWTHLRLRKNLQHWCCTICVYNYRAFLCEVTSSTHFREITCFFKLLEFSSNCRAEVITCLRLYI